MHKEVSEQGRDESSVAGVPSVMTFPVNPRNGLDVVLNWNSGFAPGTMTCWLSGEPFRVESGSNPTDECWITHRNWSLCGCGSSFATALKDLEERAMIVAPAYVDQPDAKLTESAVLLRDFLQRVVPILTSERK